MLDAMANDHQRTRYPGIYRRRGRYRVMVKGADGKWRWLAGTFTRIVDALDTQTRSTVHAERVRHRLADVSELDLVAAMQQRLGTFEPLPGASRLRVEPAAASALADYARHLRGLRRTDRHVRQVVLDLNRIFRGCRLNTLGDCIAAVGRIMAYGDDLVERGCSAR